MTTILHLTDLHLLSDAGTLLKGVPTRETLRLVLAHAREAGREIDAVVITGDFAHDEQRPSYVALRELLGDLVARCLFVPGVLYVGIDRGGCREHDVARNTTSARSGVAG